MSANVFISFASQDLKVATALCQALETRGFSCWISARDIEPGDNFQSAIVSAIQNAKAMLLVFSAHSNTSNEMTKELALASQQKLIVVPLRIEDVAPNAAFAYEFATRQWIDLFIDWEKAINQLCARLARALPAEGGPAQATFTPAAIKTAPTPPPPELRRSNPLPLVLGIGAAVVLIVGALVALPMLRGKPAASSAPAAVPAAAAVASAPAPSATPAAPVTTAPTPAAPAAPAPVQTASAAPIEKHHRREAEAEAADKPAKVAAVDTRSDAYVCAHGDASDLRTVHACDRLDWSGAQADTH